MTHYTSMLALHLIFIENQDKFGDSVETTIVDDHVVIHVGGCLPSRIRTGLAGVYGCALEWLSGLQLLSDGQSGRDCASSWRHQIDQLAAANVLWLEFCASRP